MMATWRDARLDGSGRLVLPRARRGRTVGDRREWTLTLDPETQTLRRGSIDVAPDGALEIRLPFRLESPNTLLHAHWRDRDREKRVWAARLDAAINGRALATVVDRRRLHIARLVASGRALIRDRENLVYSVKFLVDRIRNRGLIRDDSMRWIDLEVTQAVSDDRRDWTVIHISIP